MINKVIEKMIRHDQGDPRRIQHFLKVHSFAKYIGECEGLDKHTQLILETAALVHDIGIRPLRWKASGTGRPETGRGFADGIGMPWGNH